MSIQLRCPACHNELALQAKGACCENNHQFDRAKQGYLNLLPSHKMRSKTPGDDKTMVQARTRFLNDGYYQPVAQALRNAIKPLVDHQKVPCILDAGCGEGYYTTEVRREFVRGDFCGLDISKPAILASSKRDKTMTWLVGSVVDLPFMDQQFDVIISVFSRCDWQEFTRVLKPGGHIIMLAPGKEHLLELRQAIYEQVRPYPVDKQVEQLPDALRLIESQPVSCVMHLPDTQAIMDLLAMTPHYWHVKPDQKARLQQLQQLSCRLDMKLYRIQKTE